MWSLKLKATPTPEEKLLLKFPADAKTARQAMKDMLRAKAFVRYVEDDDALLLNSYTNLQTLSILEVGEDGTVWRTPFDGWATMMITKTIVLLGDPGFGKSTLARTFCATHARANNAPYYIETNTPDSLRLVCEQHLFLDNVPILLDEWRPAGAAGARFTGTDGVYMLKCLTTVGKGGTVSCRYSDIRLLDNMPRLMTCNCRTLEEWTQGIGNVPKADIGAVMRRVAFIEVSDHIIPERLRKQYIKRQHESCYDKIAMQLKYEGYEPLCEEDIVSTPLEKKVRLNYT